ncbi:MAG: TlpA family protein disulfide reductase [Dysgonamonadaceae bacterium]|jgi:hypothetical protein|nr:TlpA family protein disulfide reductase [Dysgonamonadaceae bacterium]
MKKITFLSLIVFALGFSAAAKDSVIVKPAYEFSNSGISHISKIVLNDKETRVSVHETFIPHWWVRFDTNSYLEDCGSGKRYPVQGIEGGEFAKEIYMPDSGDSTFVLIFPPLDKSVTKINYIDADSTEAEAATIYGISLNPKETRKPKEMSADVRRWLDGELAKAKRKTPMDIEHGEFFEKDTARLVGYIKGYDRRAGFSTGIIYASNELTREDYPIVLQIHEDGRFECNIPLNYPVCTSIHFQRSTENFYIEPGQTLAVLLDWEDFRMADRCRNIRYKFQNTKYEGVLASLNAELFSFDAKLPEIPYRRIYDEIDKYQPAEFKTFLQDLLKDYNDTFSRLLETEPLSPRAQSILTNKQKMDYATYLFEYEMDYKGRIRNTKDTVPYDFYDFLDAEMLNDKTLLTDRNFSVFINRFEYSDFLSRGRLIVYNSLKAAKTYTQYLFEELGIQKIPEDEAFILMQDSLNIKLNRQGITSEDQQRILGDYSNECQKFKDRHGVKRFKDYNAKYVDIIKPMSGTEIEIEAWRLSDSLYYEVIKGKPGIIYEVAKVRSVDFRLQPFKDNKDDARSYLTNIENGITQPFLLEEAERLFWKNFPAEAKTAYELPDSPEARIFKDIIAPFEGKYLLVDLWATTCGPCVYNIKKHKALRAAYKNSPDIAFLFITSDDESPAESYNKFVAEQELTHTWRLNADEYRYLRQLFRFNGIPHYVLVDREGKILDDDLRGHNFENIITELMEKEKK